MVRPALRPESTSDDLTLATKVPGAQPLPTLSPPVTVFNTFLRPAPATKATDVDAAIVIIEPSRGLRPSLCGRSLGLKTPKPVMVTALRDARASVIDCSVASKAFAASALGSPDLVAMESMRSLRTTRA